MTNSGTQQQPDLDWSQIRETVKLLTVSVAMVQSGMHEGDASVAVLADALMAMGQNLSALEKALQSLENASEKAQALDNIQALQAQVQSSIEAVQFYDRLQQCLDHVVHNLDGLSSVISDPQRLYNPLEWQKFQQDIRKRYTMEPERVMFDAILAGKSIDEAIDLARQANQQSDKIELF